MKNKGVKICMIVLLGIIAISLISIMIINIASKDKSYKISLFKMGDHTEKLFEDEYYISEIENIKVSTTSSNVKFIEGNNDKAKVTIYGVEGTNFEVNKNDKELQISEENHNFYIFALFFWSREEIIVEIPKDYIGIANIEVTSGNVEVSNFENVDAIIEGKSGNVKCGDLKNVDINVSSGNISVGNTMKANLKANSGNIRLGNAENRNIKHKLW